jgi:GR25 family glycosyltransferase involved in LPS biosynthesis
MALENKMDHILIVEDDITFLNPSLFVNQLNTFLHNQNKNKRVTRFIK